MSVHHPNKRELAEENKRLRQTLAYLQSGASVRIYPTNADRQRAYRQRKAMEAVSCS